MKHQSNNRGGWLVIKAALDILILRVWHTAPRIKQSMNKKHTKPQNNMFRLVIAGQELSKVKWRIGSAKATLSESPSNWLRPKFYHKALCKRKQILTIVKNAKIFSLHMTLPDIKFCKRSNVHAGDAEGKSGNGIRKTNAFTLMPLTVRMRRDLGGGGGISQHGGSLRPRHGDENWVNFSPGKRCFHCENAHRLNKCQHPKISQCVLHVLPILRCWSTVDHFLMYST